MTALLLFPHQLWFEFPSSWNSQLEIYLIEEHLFFKQYKFHKQKIAYHRASMRNYAEALKLSGSTINYIDSFEPMADVRALLPWLKSKGIEKLELFEPDDFLLKKRILRCADSEKIMLKWNENQLFINTIEDLNHYKDKTKKLFQTDFYIHQRKTRNILLDPSGSPLGGRWSYDTENRKSYPKNRVPPKNPHCDRNRFHEEAKNYVETHFGGNFGELSAQLHYPTNPEAAQNWLNNFFEERFAEFGEFEDAIVSRESFLHHSVLTPMLNVGILKPLNVIQKAIDYANHKKIEINSLEGFVRQLLGWREFVRYVYHFHSVKQRTTNFWGFDRQIPDSFYTGTTGIKPLDDCILKLQNTAYNHHIERLMVISNFMLLCEFDPNKVYRWFMEMYIDAYDWVMVTNVYGMAQFSDGGLMVTKPYISGSNYIFKMSDYKKGEPWADIWDALFWRFMHVNRSFFQRNPRLSMLLNTFDKWPEEKKTIYLDRAEKFLNQLNAKAL